MWISIAIGLAVGLVVGFGISSYIFMKKPDPKNVGNLILTRDDEDTYIFLEIVGTTPENIARMHDVNLTVRKNNTRFNGTH